MHTGIDCTEQKQKKGLNKGLVPLIYGFVVVVAYNLCETKGSKHMDVMFQHWDPFIFVSLSSFFLVLNYHSKVVTGYENLLDLC